MDSYVVRIYRRDAQNPHNIAGSVEMVASEEPTEKTFTDFNELRNILSITSENRGSERFSAKQKKE